MRGFKSFSCLPLLVLIFSLSACSLLDVKIENPSIPLSDKQMNTRVLTRDFLSTYFSTIENAADAALMKDNRIDHQLSLTYWKLSSEQAAVKAVLHEEPTVALIDFWLLIAEQSRYFGLTQAQAFFPESHTFLNGELTMLEERFAALATQLLTGEEYQLVNRFIEQQIAAMQPDDFSFDRRSIIGPWYEFQGLNLADADSNVGSLPQVMSNLSDRIDLVTSQTGKSLSWQFQLSTLKSRFQQSQLQTIVDNLSATSEQLASITAEQSPQRDAMIKALSDQFQPLMNQFENQLQLFEASIGEEREALSEFLHSERKEILKSVASEKDTTIEQLNELMTGLISTTIKEAESLVIIVVVGFILLVIFLFVLPFSLGYLFAKARFHYRAHDQSR
jgi:hypothetical protein